MNPMVEETLRDSGATYRFALIGSSEDLIPEETTILNLRHLLERRGLTKVVDLTFLRLNAHGEAE